MCGTAGYIGDAPDRAEPIVSQMTDCLSWRVFRVNADAVVGCHGHTAETGYVPNRNWYIYVLESRLSHESAALRQASGPYSLT